MLLRPVASVEVVGKEDIEEQQSQMHQDGAVCVGDRVASMAVPPHIQDAVPWDSSKKSRTGPVVVPGSASVHITDCGSIGMG